MFSPSPLMIVLAILVVSILLGSYFSRLLKMKEIAWKLTAIILAFTLGVAVLRFGTPSLGIDLRGGNILIYEIDTERTLQAMATDFSADQPAPDQGRPGQSLIDMTGLIQSLQRRINPGGVREIVIREYGANQVEIIIPEVDNSEIETIKEAIRKTGFLKFRIIADATRHPFLWQLGEKQLASEDEHERFDPILRDEGVIVGEWIRLGREDVTTPGEVPPYRMDPADVQRNMLWRELVPGQIEILTKVDEETNVEGSHLAAVNRGVGDTGYPTVEFMMTTEGATRMGRLTGSSLPDPQTGNEARLGIVLDNELLSAPGIRTQISTNGRIEGRFSDKEVNTLLRILRDGKMPAVLFPEPISENNISPLLGVDTIRKGSIATLASLLLVVLFMLWYYRFPGLIACIALAGNLMLTVATLILISASFTLPGIAGLVLTVGMSVDANVLIYERIREELKRGASLRMALRNGFERATTTIIDSNLTTVVVAVVLYMIGTADLRGFAITLIVGILMSMFTAIFCSRVFFDVAERKRWIRTLKFRELMPATNIPFCRLGPASIVASLVIIAIGFFGVYARGQHLFDIDFLGGSAVQIVLKEPMPIEDVRDKLRPIADDVWVTQINPVGKVPQTVFKVDTSLQNEAELQEQIRNAMQGLLETRSMQFTPVVPYEASSPTIQGVGLRGIALDQHAFFVAGRDPWPADAEPQTEDPAPATPSTEPQEPEATDNEANTELSLEADTVIVPESESATENAPPTTDGARSDESRVYRSMSKVTFQDKTSASTVRRLIDQTAKDLKIASPRIRVTNPGWDGRSEAGFTEWDVAFTSSPDETERILATIHEEISEQPVWLSSSLIGGKIAGGMRIKALQAIFWSLIAIIIYIWFRFRSVAYGLAAVIALIHDVAVTLGFVALSAWLAPGLGFMGIEEFKISLTIVAAFLTIIGYSLNDTIVIFDRIREIKGKSPDLTEEIIDAAVNQTLSRTILTSFTTGIVVVVLYVFGGEGLHGFAFALLVGVVAGVYSTVFIACPVLLWMLNWWKARQAARVRATAVSVR